MKNVETLQRIAADRSLLREERTQAMISLFEIEEPVLFERLKSRVQRGATWFDAHVELWASRVTKEIIV